MDFPDSSVSRQCCQCRRHGSHPWLKKIPSAVWQSPMPKKKKEKERGRRQAGDAECKRLGERSLRTSGGRGSGMSKWINGGLGQAREQSGEPEV